MTSADPPRKWYLAQPTVDLSKSSRRQPSDRSDVSTPASHESDSSSPSSPMATIVTPIIYAEPGRIDRLKSDAEHIELSQDSGTLPTDKAWASTQRVQNLVRDNGDEVPTRGDHDSPVKSRRGFAAEPVETTTRSSKQGSSLDPTASPSKRRFPVEPVETSVKSSRTRDHAQEEEKSLKPRRKFAVEPVETSAKRSKDREARKDDTESNTRPKRRFAVEPVQTSSRSSKDKEEVEAKTTKPRRKFAVEPVETTTKSSRNRPDSASNGSDDNSREIPSRSSTGGRKFAPELVATAKASYRKKPSIQSAVPRWLKTDLEEENSWSAPEPQESKFSSSNLAKKARADPRRHSYTVPDLPIIQSDSSEDEESDLLAPGSLPHSYSADHVPQRKLKQKHQHNHDPFLADLQTLREQAVAAYGSNEDRIPFGHYGGDSDEEDYSVSVGKLSIHDGADPRLFRRESHQDLHLVQEDMRRHHAELERAKMELREDTAGISRFSAAALAARHHLHISHPVSSNLKIHQEAAQLKDEGNETDGEFAKMRKAASPPMQGDEIKFPFSVSPKMTRCDPDQMPRPRRSNSDDEEYDIGVEGMWSATISPTLTREDASPGLWGGLCQKNGEGSTRPTTPLLSGIQTPAFEHANLFGSRTPGHGAKTPRRGGPLWGGNAFLPLTPPRSRNEKANDGFAAALDQKLQLERQIDEEFPPRVITQIYNYLSLGYPPIARPFDEELTKISRIPIVELRKGDRSATGSMKGHVGVPEGEGQAEEDEDGRVKDCRRWDALRLYVREWARQSPLFQNDLSMSKNVGTGMWGNNAPVRKGSWGF